MTLPMFLAIAVVAAIAEFIWYRKARRQRHLELMQRRLEEAEPWQAWSRGRR